MKKGDNMTSGSDGKSSGVSKAVGLVLLLAVCLLGTFSQTTISLLQEQLKNTRNDIIELKTRVEKMSDIKENIADIRCRFENQKEWVGENKELIKKLFEEMKMRIQEYEKTNEKVSNIEREIFTINGK